MMHIRKYTLHFPQMLAWHRITLRVKSTKQSYFAPFWLLFLVAFGIFKLMLWSRLPWKWVSGEQTIGRKKIPKEDEDILLHVTDSWFISEFNKRLLVWSRHLNANEIYTCSTTAAVNFNTAVDTVIPLLDSEGKLIDISLATEFEMPLLSIFAGNRKYEVFNHPDKVRMRIAQSSVCEVKVLTSAGFMEMNPAIVKVQLQRHSKDQTQLEIQGISKEGWIRQHAGEKSVRSIAQQIEEQLRM